MKKILVLFSAIIAVAASCSSSGSVTFPLNEITFEMDGKPSEVSRYSDLFEAVPGDCKISWKVLDNLPQLTNYEVTLKFKVRLKKNLPLPANIAQLDDWELVSLLGAMHFELTDENGMAFEQNSSGIATFILGMASTSQIRKTPGLHDKEALLDFAMFLQSPVGTEYEMIIPGSGFKMKQCDCTKSFKKVRGITCKVNSNNRTYDSLLERLK